VSYRPASAICSFYDFVFLSSWFVIDRTDRPFGNSPEPHRQFGKNTIMKLATQARKANRQADTIEHARRRVSVSTFRVGRAVILQAARDATGRDARSSTAARG
jgi:hypothetical protein